MNSIGRDATATSSAVGNVASMIVAFRSAKERSFRRAQDDNPDGRFSAAAWHWTREFYFECLSVGVVGSAIKLCTVDIETFGEPHAVRLRVLRCRQKPVA